MKQFWLRKKRKNSQRQFSLSNALKKTVGKACVNIYKVSNYATLDRDDKEFKTVNTTWKVSKYGVFPGLYFPVLELNAEIFSVNLCIHP